MGWIGADPVDSSKFSGTVPPARPHLERLGHELVAIASHDRPIDLNGRVLRYPEPAKQSSLPGSALWHRIVPCLAGCSSGRTVGWCGLEADRILAHTGWAKPGSCAALAGCEAGCLAGALAFALARRVWGGPVEASVNLHKRDK